MNVLSFLKTALCLPKYNNADGTTMPNLKVYAKLTRNNSIHKSVYNITKRRCYQTTRLFRWWIAFVSIILYLA